MAVLPSGALTTPPNYVSSANLLRVYSVWSSGSLTEILNSAGPAVDLCGILLVTGFQLDFVLLITTC